MPKSWQKPLIQSHLAECQSYLEEARLSGDLNLCAELAGKMCDVLVIWRRSQEQQAEPTIYTFSDGVRRNIDAMAASHAVAEVFPELGQDDEFPAFMGRDERGT